MVKWCELVVSALVVEQSQMECVCVCVPPLALGPTGTCQVVEFSLISEERFVGRLNNDTLLQATFRKLDGGRWRAE